MRRLTVLGSCGAWPEAGRACSGFLVEYDGYRVVLDLGFGTLPRLLEHCPDGAVDAVVITHEHSDHCVDLNGLFRVRYFGGLTDRISLYCTPGVLTRVGGLEPEGTLDEVFDIHELPGSYEVGPFRLDAVPLPHFVPNAGVRMSTSDYVLAYTGDTVPDPALAELGAEADLFIVDATRHVPPPAGTRRGVLAATEAGEWAARARAKTLMLSHFWPGIDRAESVRLAGESFTGEVLAAEEGLTVELRRR
ncbi:MAG TPA: MBL fold metallo-hydrolase [Actinophytocola sp.]|jgi:ribonuclease BN (tRNA processing enzyme)|uniref:MBL fold metallo-hydrolase n=1 Tax=Actinophytocola sp. TaxID=1872138 RepID=UPI002DFE38DA|nr:MBL fold metallo-hydrolase [Actinophytocola sp.]